jgi:hypothetical protein
MVFLGGRVVKLFVGISFCSLQFNIKSKYYRLLRAKCESLYRTHIDKTAFFTIKTLKKIIKNYILIV